MKQPKRKQDPTPDLMADHTGLAGDSRPTKPPAGETTRRFAPVPPHGGRVKAEHPRSHGDARGDVRGDVRDVRRAKAAFDPGAGRPRRGLSGERANLTDQQPVGGPRADRPGEQYVRLRIRVRGDRLSVVDSNLVDGPLSQSTTFHGTNAYDVTYQDRLLHAGNVPDLGVQRSFPNPRGSGEELGHHLAAREVAEFSARVPAHEVTADTIGLIRVTLHQVKEPTDAPRLGTTPLAAQFDGQISPVAELVGLPESALPDAIAARGGRTGTGS